MTKSAYDGFTFEQLQSLKTLIARQLKKDGYKVNTILHFDEVDIVAKSDGDATAQFITVDKDTNEKFSIYCVIKVGIKVCYFFVERGNKYRVRLN